jgi:hypothetical protein
MSNLSKENVNRVASNVNPSQEEIIGGMEQQVPVGLDSTKVLNLVD